MEEGRVRRQGERCEKRVWGIEGVVCAVEVEWCRTTPTRGERRTNGSMHFFTADHSASGKGQNPTESPPLSPSPPSPPSTPPLSSLHLCLRLHPHPHTLAVHRLGSISDCM